VGLSGLITPSLDEMVSVAKEMKRRQLTIPLLIGGATTSKQHTAVKISPNYDESTVHVHDASRAVGVVSDLLDPQRKQELDRRNRDEQERMRARYASTRERPLLSYREAIARRTPITWRPEDISRPSFVGRRVVDDVSLREITAYIDWTYFFMAWELRGKFPAILEDPTHGEAARDLYASGRALLDRIVREELVAVSGVYGFWPAGSDRDDIVLYTDEQRTTELTRLSMLRQQVSLDGRPSRSLADFIAPIDSGLEDWIGAFAVTAGLGADALAAAYERDHDDYSAIMVKALADRLAEAFAELLHQRVRREWGYGGEEALDNDDLIAEKYRGIRPAFGYPACPDHTPKRRLFDLLDAPGVGITLTESYAMSPAASVSGIYFSHPEARYFSVGRIGRDQVEDYARRTGMSPADVERWLSSNLGYEPD